MIYNDNDNNEICFYKIVCEFVINKYDAYLK